MANRNCQSCAELQTDAPGLIVNGMTETECTSLANDTGLNPASGNNDCTDLNNMNDCLIGNMVDEIDAYDVCDWKEYTKNFVDNVWTVFKGVICAICGLWTSIHNLQTEVESIEQEIVPMPKDIIFADVSKRQTLVPGFPDDQTNRVDIPCSRTDGFRPMGIVGWNLNNAPGQSGVSNCNVFKAKLMGNYVSIQIRNNKDSNLKIDVEATVLYMKV